MSKIQKNKHIWTYYFYKRIDKVIFITLSQVNFNIVFFGINIDSMLNKTINLTLNPVRPVLIDV